MPQTIKEIHDKFHREPCEEEKALNSEIYRKELSFISRLDDVQKEEYIKIRMNNYHLNKITDEKSFEYGFYIAYRLLKEMNDGVKGTYNFLNSLYLD